jgi:hypothetical protein
VSNEQQAPVEQRLAYLVVQASDVHNFERQLNAAAQDGWRFLQLIEARGGALFNALMERPTRPDLSDFPQRMRGQPPESAGCAASCRPPPPRGGRTR